MTMPIFIPSMERANAIFHTNSTIRAIRDVPNDIYFVVPKDEVGAYARAMKNNSRDEVKILACTEKGIAKTRHWIGLYCKKHKFDKFVMMDDDLRFAVRSSADGNALRAQTHDDTLAMLRWTEEALDNYAHAGVSPRDAAKTETVASGDAPLTLENKRTLRYLAYRTKDFLSVEHGRVEVMEDFDVNLQLIRSGRSNIQTYWWTTDQPQTGSPGGCSSYRSLQVHENSAKKLAEMHAPFVTLRQKENKAAVVKSAKEFQKRTEVTIYWEKAAKSAGWIKK